MSNRFIETDVTGFRFLKPDKADRTESIHAVSLERILLEHGYSGTLTDKNGRKITYQDGKRVAGQHDQGGGKQPAAAAADSTDHEKTLADIKTTLAKDDLSSDDLEALQAKLDSLPDDLDEDSDAHKAVSFLDRAAHAVDAYTGVADLADSTGKATFLTRGAVTLLDLSVTTFGDMNKWGGALLGKYGASGDVSGVDAIGHNTGMMVHDLTGGVLSNGIPSMVAAKLAATVLYHAWKKFRKLIGRSEAIANASDEDVASAAKFLSGMINAAHEGTDIKDVSPEDVAAILKGLTPAKPEPTPEAKQPINVTVNIVEAATKRVRKVHTKQADGTWYTEEREVTDGE